MQICKTKKVATRLFQNFNIIIVYTCVIKIQHLTKNFEGEIIRKKKKENI